jgi:glycosyltransferase involved in cell wall biosynthesis
MTRRKILLYLPALLGGGAERVFALLASEFAARGHEVIFAVDHEAQENAAFLSEKVRLHVLPAGHLRATLGLAELLRQEKPDCSLSGLGVANLKHMLAALLAGRRRHAMLSFHAFFETENLTGRLSQWGNTLTPLLTRLCAQNIAVSEGLKRYIIEQKGAFAPRVTRIYNPVMAAPEGVQPDAAALRARPPVVAYLGRFHPDKDVGTLLRAFARVTYPGATLVLGGDSVERPAYEALAQELGIAGRVTFLGYLKDPSPLLREARVFAFSSLRESFANVVAEALVHGLPVVTTATAGPTEILEDGRFGTLVPIGDVEALARGIDAALADPGDPGPRLARARQFSVPVAADHYLALMEQVITQAQGA